MRSAVTGFRFTLNIVRGGSYTSLVVSKMATMVLSETRPQWRAPPVADLGKHRGGVKSGDAAITFEILSVEREYALNTIDGHDGY